MKIRQGFVSNSSSSSFCIYGICVGEQKVKDALIAKGVSEDELIDSVCEYLDDWSYNRKKRDGQLTAEDIKAYEGRFFKPEDGFSVNCPYDWGEEIYIGVEWSSIKDDETGAAFKARIEAKLQELLGKDISCGTLSEAWRDG